MPRGAQSQKKEQLDIYAKNDAEKNIENMRKGYQNDAQMDTNIYEFSYFFEKGENARNYLFYNRKLVSEQVKNEKTIIQNRCKIEARKMDAERT